MTGRYKAYPEYKESGVEWFEYIPRNWSLSRLKFSSLINMGQSPNSDDCNTNGIGLAFLQGNAEFGEKHPTEKQFCPVSKKIAKAGELLFSVRAPVGAVNIADKDYGIGRGLCSIKNKFNVEQKFLWWVLPAYKKQFDAVSTGSTFEAVSAEQVGNLAFGLPSFEEQQKIASFLDHETAKIDTLITKQEKLIELLKEKRQAVISHAVTKGLNPDAPMKDSGVEWLGEVPEHWGKVAFKQFIKTRKGVAFSTSDFCDSGIRVVKASDIKQLSLRKSDVFLPETFTKKYPKAYLNQGNIILSTVGSTPDVKNSAVGQIAMVPKELDGTLLNQNTVVFDPTVEAIDRNYLFLLLQTRAYRDHLDLHAHGTANQASLNVADMLDFKCFIPSIDEQHQIAEYLKQFLGTVSDLETKAISAIELMKERKTALISAAVTGKIDVRYWEKDN